MDGAVEQPFMKDAADQPSEMLPRTPPSSLNPLRWLDNLWTGSDVATACAHEEALIRHFVKTPFKLGRVKIDLQHLGLGTQYIATLDINSDVRSGVPIVWAHGAGAGLGFGYRNYDELAKLGGKRRRVIAFDWLGQAGSTRPAFPYGRWGLGPAPSQP